MKEHAWKACVRAIVPRVRIPPSPPFDSSACDELAHGRPTLILKLIMFPEVECPELVEGRFTVYILQCGDGSFYVGHTNNLKKRLNYHNSQNGAVWIKKRLPANLVFFFVCSKKQALFLEKKLKGRRREKKEKLIRREWSLDYFRSSH